MALPGQKLLAPTFVRKIADETVNNSAAFQADNELLLAALPNYRYQFAAEIRYSTNTTANLKWVFSVPTGATFVYSALHVPAGGTALTMTEFINAAGGTASGSLTRLRLSGLLDMGATAGNLLLQWAQNTANASNTMVQNFSWMRLDRVG